MAFSTKLLMCTHILFFIAMC